MVNFFKPAAKKNNLHQTVTIDIQRLDINGDGVSRLNKKPLFVNGALPDETVAVKIIEEKSKYLRAKVLNVITPSSQRVTPQCKHFYQCGGCDLQHLSEAGQLQFKQAKVAELFARNANLTELPWTDTLATDPWYYRRKARIGVQYNKLNEAIVGFRRKNSNVLTQVSHCVILAEQFAQEFTAFTNIINSLKTKKAISHIEVIAADIATVIFRHIRPLTKHDTQLLENFCKNKTYQLVLQDESSVRLLNGEPSPLLSYQIAGCNIQFSETDFVQINAKLNEQMVEQACQWLQLEKTDNVLDLFCGLGNFSLPIAKQVNSVVGVEGIDSMVARATNNSLHNNLNNSQFFQADLNSEDTSWPWFNNDINKIILDPARAGALQVVTKIIEFNVPTVLYISCDPATMSRDAKVLIDHGYKLEKLALMDMFAQTRHVETMALFKLI